MDMRAELDGRARGLLWAAVAIALAACGDDGGDSATGSDRDASALESDGGMADAAAPDRSSIDVEMTVGPEGGELSVEGVEVGIPEGALDEEVQIRIRVVPEPVELPTDWEASGEFYEITPHGLSFAVPITIELPYDGAQDESLNLVKLDDEDDESWAETETEGFDGGKVRFSTSSLSFYAVVRICPLDLDSLEPGAVLTGCEDRECGSHPEFAVCGSCGSCGSGESCDEGGMCRAERPDAGIADAGARPDSGVRALSGVPMQTLAVGTTGACRLRPDDGTAECWGSDGAGASSPPPETRFLGVVRENGIACGIRATDQQLECWLRRPQIRSVAISGGTDEMVEVTPEGVAFRYVSITQNRGCGVRAEDGFVQCWGDDFMGGASPPADVAFDQVSAGIACGLRSDNQRIECWGGSTLSPPEDVAFASMNVGSALCGVRADDRRIQCWAGSDDLPEDAFDMISISSSAACGILAGTGTVKCWPVVNSIDTGVTLEPPPGVVFQSVAVGFQFACGERASDGEVMCWGRNYDLQAVPPNGSPRFASMDLTAIDHKCGVRAEDGRVDCWTPGQVQYLESGPPDVAFTSVVVGGGTHMSQSACGIRAADGEVQCWGNDFMGNTSPPAGVAFSQLSSRDVGYCGIRAVDGIVQCWGRATQPPEDTAYREIGPSCGIRAADGELDCWDRPDLTFPSGSYVQVSGSCALSQDGLVSCVCDSNRYNPAHCRPPVGVGFDSIAVGTGHGCGIRRADKEIQCWGIGDGMPLTSGFDDVGQWQAPPGVRFTKVMAGGNTTCAIRESDQVEVCWGEMGRNHPWSSVR